MRLWDVSIAATAIQCLRPLRRRPRVRQYVPQKNLARISQVSRARRVKGTIPRHQRAVFAFKKGGVGRCGSERRRILPAHSRANALEIEHGSMGTPVRKTLAQ